MDAPFRIRSDMKRMTLDGFTFPLGVEHCTARPAREGYSVSWVEAEEEGLDAYTFYVVVSHDRLPALLGAAMRLLPGYVAAIMEVGSRDAFRPVDVFLSAEAIDVGRFMEGWERYNRIFLEDASLAVGVNADAPFIEIFLDQDKRVTIHVQPERRSEVEAMLETIGLIEQDDAEIIVPDEELERTRTRPILVDDPNLICDVDQLLLELRHEWVMELDEDHDRNLDSSGKDLGRTLWHAIVLVDRRDGPGSGAGHATVWATARSRTELETLVRERLYHADEWQFGEFYTTDRVAFDDRPEELTDMRPRHPHSEILMMHLDAPGAGIGGNGHG